MQLWVTGSTPRPIAITSSPIPRERNGQSGHVRVGIARRASGKRKQNGSTPPAHPTKAAVRLRRGMKGPTSRRRTINLGLHSLRRLTSICNSFRKKHRRKFESHHLCVASEIGWHSSLT